VTRLRPCLDHNAIASICCVAERMQNNAEVATALSFLS
jgi:hypothetical protein